MYTSTLEWLIPIVFGYPAIALAILCSGLGNYLRKPGLLLAGSLISAPPAFYLGSTPLFRFFGYSLPLFNVVAAYALFKKRIWLAVLFLFPNIAVLCYLLVVLLFQ